MENVSGPQIEKLCSAFRLGLEKACKDRPFEKDPVLSGFPRECCDEASGMLAIYLFLNQVPTRRVAAVAKYDPEAIPTRHVWLELENGIVIDITGDQFKGRDDLLTRADPCYVGPPDDFQNQFCLCVERGELLSEIPVWARKNDYEDKMLCILREMGYEEDSEIIQRARRELECPEDEKLLYSATNRPLQVDYTAYYIKMRD